MKNIDARTEAEKALGEEEAVTLGLTIFPEGRGTLQMVAINAPNEDPKIILDLTQLDEGGMRFGLTTGFPFNEADGLDGLVMVMETYVELLKNPVVRATFVEERILPTQPALFGDDEHAPEPGA